MIIYEKFMFIILRSEESKLCERGESEPEESVRDKQGGSIEYTPFHWVNVVWYWNIENEEEENPPGVLEERYGK